MNVHSKKCLSSLSFLSVLQWRHFTSKTNVPQQLHDTAASGVASRWGYLGLIIGPLSLSCDAPFTVRHFLLECGDFAQVRNNCFHVDSMKKLFQDIHMDSIMTFLRQINLFNKI